jgi:protocatechuate 3,4-dioxygenase beta subunit
MTTPTYSPRDWSSQPPFVFPAHKSTIRRGPTRPLVPLAPSPSELTGPVYVYRLDLHMQGPDETVFFDV